MTDHSDWRLSATVPGIAADPLGRLVSHLRRRADEELDEIKGAAGADIVVTHDGTTLFAYGATRDVLESAASVISEVLADHGQQVEIFEARWDETRETWAPVDGSLPNPRKTEVVDRGGAGATARVTRTFVVSAGKFIDREFEAGIEQDAKRRGLTCTVIEHPHLLTTQLAFTVAGPRLEVKRLHKDMIHAGWRTIANAEALTAPWAGP